MRTLALTLPLLLAACSGPETEPGAEDAVMADAANALSATDFAELATGAPIVGPLGPEVTGEFEIGGRVIADIVSHVACPAPAGGPALADDQSSPDECVPGQQADGALFTYVHRVTPKGIEGDDGVAPLAFRTTQPASGFAGMIGYDHVQAAAALGENYLIELADDDGALVWLIQAGDGWSDGEEITFFWQSTLPPAGPARAYAIETIAGDALGTGPFRSQR